MSAKTAVAPARKARTRAALLKAVEEAEEAHPIPFDPQEAFRNIVYRFGVEKMARELRIKRGTLYNRCELDVESSAQPTLANIIQVTRLTGDTAILDSLDRMFNRAAFDVADLSHLSDHALLELLARLGKEDGEFHAALCRALADKRFTKEDLQRVRAEAFDVVSALFTLVARLEGLVDD